MSVGSNPRLSWNAQLCGCHSAETLSTRSVKFTLVNTGVPPFTAASAGDAGASGSGVMYLRRAADVIDYSFVLRGLSAPVTGVHVHDKAGALVLALNIVPSKAGDKDVQITGRMTTADDAALATKIDKILADLGNHYVGVESATATHTTALSSGLLY